MLYCIRNRKEVVTHEIGYHSSVLGGKRVNIVSKYPYDIDLRSGRHVVDAKSILGIFSLDLNKPITMEVYENNCDDLLAEIKPFIV